MGLNSVGWQLEGVCVCACVSKTAQHVSWSKIPHDPVDTHQLSYKMRLHIPNSLSSRATFAQESDCVETRRCSCSGSSVYRYEHGVYALI